jgi:hypothetical protein
LHDSGARVEAQGREVVGGFASSERGSGCDQRGRHKSCPADGRCGCCSFWDG